jgi:hypothetical protein
MVVASGTQILVIFFKLQKILSLVTGMHLDGEVVHGTPTVRFKENN